MNRRLPFALAILGGLGFIVMRARPSRPLQDAPPHAPSPFVSSGPAKRFDRWSIIGPGGGGAQYNAAVSPHDPNLVLVSCDMTGAYISEDGGNSWREFNLWGRVQGFAFDPVNPNVIYTRGQGLWKSADRGKTWSLFYPDAKSVTATVPMAGDEAVSGFMTAHGVSQGVNAFAVDPSDSAVLYLSQGQTVLESRNGGQSWSNLISGLPAAARKIYVDPRSPAGKRHLYLIGTNWTAVWADGKLQNAAKLNGWIYDSAVGFSPSGPAAMYVITDYRPVNGVPSGGFLVSRDDGRTWQPGYEGLLKLRASDSNIMPVVTALALSPSHPDTVYISYTRMVLPGGKGAFGVARSTDAGATWNLIWRDPGHGTVNVYDAWLSDALGSDWAENPIGLGMQETNPDVVYATDYGRTLRSTDGGKTWVAVYAYQVPGGGYTTTGLDVTTCYGIFFDPFDRKRQFIAYTDIGIFRSEDSGKSWNYSTKGIPRQWRNTTYWLEFDPKVQGRMWAASSMNHDLPRMKMLAHGTAAFKGGVSISQDGGKTWEPSNKGMPDSAITHLLLDPASPPEHRVLYAAGMGRGVFKSVDGGASWTLKNNGLPGSQPLAWRLAFDSRRNLYLVTVRRSTDLGYGTDDDGMLFRSQDGAETWQRVKLPDGVNGLTGIAVDPQDPQRLYVSAWGRYDARYSRPPQQGGVWMSEDGGTAWHNVCSAVQYMYDVTVDPRNPALVYAAGYQAGVWRSADRGRTWARLRGYNFKAAQRVIPDPFDPAMIYVATYGSSVWRGPAAGDPEAPEDIAAPPAVRFSR